MSEDAEVTISYLILCHDSPDRIVRLVTRILSDDETGQVVIHFDKNSSRAKFNELKARLHGTSRCHILENRVRCGWGQWSLVEASIRMLSFSYVNQGGNYYILLSEFCHPAQHLNILKAFLSSMQGFSFIECFSSSWIQGGLREHRYLYRHIIDKRRAPKLHRYMYLVQKKLRLKRKIPEELDIRFGSQWWCFEKKMVAEVLNTPKDIVNFFKVVWIPDECFFQSIAFKSSLPVISNGLTFYSFDEKGVPRNYSQGDAVPRSYFFFRKVKD